MRRTDPATNARREEQSQRLDRFVQRATDEGILRADVPAGWARKMLDSLVDRAAHDFPDIEPPQAADLIADTMLNGVRKPWRARHDAMTTPNALSLWVDPSQTEPALPGLDRPR